MEAMLAYRGEAETGVSDPWLPKVQASDEFDLQ